jgi:hypothetical protein
MDDPRNPHDDTPGNVVPFRGHAPGSDPNASHAAQEPSAPKKSPEWRWLDGIWVLVASLLAAYRVWVAGMRRETFGLEASTAFVLLVTTPLLRPRRVVAVASRIRRALRPGSAPRDDAEHARGRAPQRPAGGPGKAPGARGWRKKRR